MDEAVEEHLNNLANRCIASPHFAALSEEEKAKVKIKIQDHFSNIVFDKLVDNLTEEQVNEVKDMDPKDPEMIRKMQLFAAGIPGFIFTLLKKLNDEATRITQTGHVPS